MENRKELYLNKEVAAVVGITKRQVLSWTEKGLIVPSEESLGVGTKRRYSYINLLEFGLCKSLFAMGFGFRAVKMFVDQLRTNYTIQDWVNNWRNFYTESSRLFKEYWEKHIKETFMSDTLKAELQVFIKKFEEYVPEEKTGVVAFFFGDKKSKSLLFIPWVSEPHFGLTLFWESLREGDSCILINLGKIRKDIDEKV